MKQGVTLGDVAALAGVSIPTASRALSGTGRVSAETRSRVVEIAERLNFRPNALAKSFATGRSGVIGLVIESPRTFTMPVLIGANTTLGGHGMATLVIDVHSSKAERGDAIQMLNNRQVDGSIIVGHAEPHLNPDLYSDLDAPAVFVFGVQESRRAATFHTDGFGAGRLAGDHLTSLGRKSIAHITAAGDPSARQRAAGLAASLEEAGLTIAGGGPITGDWSRKTGELGMRRLLDQGGPIDAVFCGNDQIAWGAYAVLRDAGVRVPEDIALIGYDHWTALLESSSNFLSTIDPNLSELGAAAADYLIDALNGTYAPGVRTVAPTLVPGLTTLGADDVIGESAGGASRDLSLQMWIGSI